MRSYNGVNISIIKDRSLTEIIRSIDLFLRDIGPAFVQLEDDVAAGGGGGGAPTGASYVTIANEAGLSAERRLAVNAPITLGDAGPDTTVTIGATLVTPAIVLGTAAAAGAAASLIRSDSTIAAFDATLPADLALAAGTGSVAFAARRDHVHRFPTSLMSTASLATLTATDDGADTILTGSLGDLFLIMPEGYSFRTTGNPNKIAVILGTPGSGTTTLLAPQWVGANMTSVTARCWDAIPPASGILTTATLIGYDTSSFSIAPSATSDTANKAYCARLSGPVVTTVNGGFTDFTTLLLEAPRRLVSSGTIPTGTTITVECPTVGTTDQIGLYIKQRTAQLTATNRYAVKIDTHNSGTNRWSVLAADRCEVQSQSAQATTALLLRQLATGATAGAHLNLDDKAGNPPSPNAGDLWRNGASLNYRKDGVTTVDLTAAAGGGDNITVNTTAATDADFDDVAPAAPSVGFGAYTGLNTRWQIDTAATPDDVSSYIGKDLNGNWMLGFIPNASAVNFIGIVNAVTTVGPRILAIGTDTNVDLRIGGQGASGRVMYGPPGAGETEVVTRSHFTPLAALAFAGAMA